MTHIKRATLIPLVIAEAIKLKDNATREEINNLNIARLDANDVTSCIYGQMTGNCYSKRAVSLIELSCEKVIRVSTKTCVNGTLNGSPVKAIRDFYWSPIEVFIYRNQFNGGKRISKSVKQDENKKLVAFLKGETEILTLK